MRSLPPKAATLSREPVRDDSPQWGEALEPAPEYDFERAYDPDDDAMAPDEMAGEDDDGGVVGTRQIETGEPLRECPEYTQVGTRREVPSSRFESGPSSPTNARGAHYPDWWDAAQAIGTLAAWTREERKASQFLESVKASAPRMLPDIEAELVDAASFIESCRDEAVFA